MKKNVLIIHSSPRTGSISRRLTEEVAESLKQGATGIVTRDLAAAPLPHLTEETVNAYFTPPDKRTEAQRQSVAASDQAVDELLAADVILIGAPMWNFSVPSSLKAWIDHIVRAGRTFSFREGGLEGLVKGKRVILVVSSGSVYSEGPLQGMDFLVTYLKSVLGFIGISNVEVIRAEGTSVGGDGYAKAEAGAHRQIEALLAAQAA